MEGVAYVQMRLYDPEGYDADGNLFVDAQLLEWQTFPVVQPEVCNHEDMMCSACHDSWACDWEIVADKAAEEMLDA